MSRVLYVICILFVIAHYMGRYCNFLWQVHCAFTLGSVTYFFLTKYDFCAETCWNNFYIDMQLCKKLE